MIRINHKLITCLLCMLLCGWATPLLAQDEDLFELSLEELMTVSIITSSKVVDDLDKAPGSIQIIDRQQIEDLNARTLREVLTAYVPGMDVVPGYFLTGSVVNEGIYSRGILSDFNQQVLILLNGHSKYNETTFGSPFPAMDITLENIERIEINNSPEPTLGSGALTTINIVTREQEAVGNEWWANMGINTQEGIQSTKLTGITGHRIGGWKVSGSVQLYQDQGQAHPESEVLGFTGQNNQLRDATYPSSNLSLYVKSPDSKLSIGSWYKNVNRSAYLSNLNPSPDNDLFYFGTRSLLNQLSYTPAKNTEITAGLSTFAFDNLYNLDEFLPYGVNERRQIPFQLSLRNYNAFAQAGQYFNASLAGKHKIFAAIRVENEGQADHHLYEYNEANQAIDVTQVREEEFNTLLGDYKRTLFSAFAEDNWVLSDKFNVLLGLRFDAIDNFGTSIQTLNPRAAIVYNPSPSLVFKGLYSQAVRAPGIYETHGSRFLPGLYGNNKLNPERLQTYEVQAIYRAGALRLQVNPFYQVLKDQIHYAPSQLDNTINVATNTGETEVTGIEWRARYEWITGNYFFINGAHIKSIDKVSDQRTNYLPGEYLNAGVNLSKGDFSLNLNGSYRNDRPAPFYTGDPADTRMLLANTSLTWKPNRTWRFYLQASNLFNAASKIPLHAPDLYLPIQQRVINVGMRVKL